MKGSQGNTSDNTILDQSMVGVLKKIVKTAQSFGSAKMGLSNRIEEIWKKFDRVTRKHRILILSLYESSLLKGAKN